MERYEHDPLLSVAPMCEFLIPGALLQLIFSSKVAAAAVEAATVVSTRRLCIKFNFLLEI